MPNMAALTESKGFGISSVSNPRINSEDFTGNIALGSENYILQNPSHPIITHDVEIKGELAFSGELEFNGRFEGQLKSGGTISFGEASIVKGSINAESVIIAGKILGDVTASNKIHLRPEATVIGNLKAKLIVIEEGAFLDGKVLISDTDRTPPDFENIFSRIGTGSKGSVSKSPHPPTTSS